MKLKLLGNPATANIFALFALAISIVTLGLSRCDRMEDKANVLVFSRDDVRDKAVYLKFRSDGEIAITTPIRYVLSNRSSKAHPLTELYLQEYDYNSQHIKSIIDKNGNIEPLPISIEPNTARVIEFHLNSHIPKKLALSLCKASKVSLPSSENPSIELCLYGDLLDIVQKLDKESRFAYYRLTHTRKLVFHFSTTKQGNPYYVEDSFSLP